MIPWIRRFFIDESSFERWSRALLLALGTALMSGTITWPAWLPAWVIPLLTLLGAAVGAGEKNPTTTQIKTLAKEAENQPLEEIHAEPASRVLPGQPVK